MYSIAILGFKHDMSCGFPQLVSPILERNPPPPMSVAFVKVPQAMQTRCKRFWCSKFGAPKSLLQLVTLEANHDLVYAERSSETERIQRPT